MTLIKIVYWENEQVKTIDIDHTEWQTLAPNTILKLFISLPSGAYKEIHGWGAYILHEFNGKYYFGGINNTVMTTIDGETIDIPVELFAKEHPSLKFGIEVPNTVWNEINRMEFV